MIIFLQSYAIISFGYYILILLSHYIILLIYYYITILVNPLPGVETNIYLVCRFAGLLVGWLAGLLICLFAVLNAAGVQVAGLLVSWLAGCLERESRRAVNRNKIK